MYILGSTNHAYSVQFYEEQTFFTNHCLYLPKLDFLALACSKSVSKALRVGKVAAVIHLQEVSGVVFKMCQRQGIVFGHVAVGLGFQERALIVWVGHGEEGIRVTDKFIDIPLASHLKAETNACVRMGELGGSSMLQNIRLLLIKTVCATFHKPHP